MNNTEVWKRHWTIAADAALEGAPAGLDAALAAAGGTGEGIECLQALEEAWPMLPAHARSAIEARVIDFLEEEEEGGTPRIAAGARLASVLGLAAAAPALLKRLAVGPPTSEVVLACGRLGLAEARPMLRQIARGDVGLRHAAMIALVSLAPNADDIAPIVAEEYQPVSDLINTDPVRRGDPATMTTFDTLVEVVHHLHGPTVIAAVAGHLRSAQNESKNLLLADYLAAVIRQPLLPPRREPTPDEVNQALKQVRVALTA